MAKGLCISKPSRPNLLSVIAVLDNRVSKPTKIDKEKLGRLIKYLCGERKLCLMLVIDHISIIKWRIDASFPCSQIL